MTSTLMNRARRMAPLSLVALLTLAGAGASAQSAVNSAPAVPSGVVSLSAQASVDVPKDWMEVAFSVTREGAEPNAVQAQIKQAVDAALTEARKAAKPGEVEVRTGAFSIQPRYGSSGRINGWQGRGELLVEGRDKPTIAQLAGKIGSMTVSRVNFDISRQAREQAQASVMSDAVGRFRAQAALLTKQFGYQDYSVREVNVASDGSGPQPVYAMRAAMEMKTDDAPLPVEAGNGTLSVTVSGTVQMR